MEQGSLKPGVPLSDPILIEVIRNALVSATEEMGGALRRAAYSTNIKTRNDFSCAFLDAKARVIAQAYAQPTLLGALAHVVPCAVEEYGIERLSPGDAILMNDPHRGAVHLNDITLISPVFHQGVLFGFVANIAHHVDVGGGSPGSMGVASEVYQEGFIIPPVKFVSQGAIDQDLFNLILTNFRAKKENAGDFRAQIASNTVGARRLTELIDRYGMDTLCQAMGDLLDYSERRTRAELAKIPRGVYRAEDYLDDDGVSEAPVRIVVTVTVQEDRIVFDLSGCDAQRPGPANATSTMSFAAVAYVLKCLIAEDIPVNDGFYRTINMIAPEGTVVNARHPAPVAGGWEVTMRLAETILRALAPAIPDRVVAATKGCICNIAFGGVDPRTGDYYTFYETIGGGHGARPCKDGMDGVQTHVHNTENSPVEETEVNYPVRILRYELIEDSGGAGRFRGGLGIRRDYCFLGHEATFTVLSDRSKYAPWGLFGGHSGRPARYVFAPAGEARPLRSKTTVHVPPMQAVSIQTPGGGGYGSPLERSPLAVLGDLKAGRVTAERARELYRVVIRTGQWTVDEEETRRLRESASAE